MISICVEYTSTQQQHEEKPISLVVETLTLSNTWEVLSPKGHNHEEYPQSAYLFLFIDISLWMSYFPFNFVSIKF